MRERLAGESGWAVGNTLEEFQAIIEADVAKWAKTVKDAGIAVQ